MGDREVLAVSKRRCLEVPIIAKSLGWQNAKLQQDQFRVGGTPGMCDAHSLDRQAPELCRSNNLM